VMPLGGGDQAHVIAALERHKRYMRGEIAHEINLKFAPELRFRLDDSFDAAARIDALLSSGRVQRDLAPLDEEDGDAFDVDGANTENTQEGGSAR
jgi:ribosome-binding factor A